VVSLVALFVAIAAVVWGALTLVEDRGGVLPPLSWSAPAGVLALGVVVLVTALASRSRPRRDEKRPHPLSMAQMAVLGKASAHVGPIVGGLYGGYALVLLPTLDIGDRGDRAVLAGGAVLAALVLTGAGLLLERTCRVRGGRDDDEPSAPA
jgi:MFS family permease